MVQVGEQQLGDTGRFQESQIRYIIKSTALDTAGSIGGAQRQCLSKLIVNQGGKATRLHVIFFRAQELHRAPACGSRGRGMRWWVIQNLSGLSERLQAAAGD